jgi:hypothetical protein
MDSVEDEVAAPRMVTAAEVALPLSVAPPAGADNVTVKLFVPVKAGVAAMAIEKLFAAASPAAQLKVPVAAV